MVFVAFCFVSFRLFDAFSTKMRLVLLEFLMLLPLKCVGGSTKILQKRRRTPERNAHFCRSAPAFATRSLSQPPVPQAVREASALGDDSMRRAEARALEESERRVASAQRQAGPSGVPWHNTACCTAAARHARVLITSCIPY